MQEHGWNQHLISFVKDRSNRRRFDGPINFLVEIIEPKAIVSNFSNLSFPAPTFTGRRSDVFINLSKEPEGRDVHALSGSQICMSIKGGGKERSKAVMTLEHFLASLEKANQSRHQFSMCELHLQLVGSTA